MCCTPRLGLRMGCHWERRGWDTLPEEDRSERREAGSGSRNAAIPRACWCSISWCLFSVPSAPPHAFSTQAEEVKITKLLYNNKIIVYLLFNNT